MAQHIIVALIVALAAAYAVWRWMPGAWRRALAIRLGADSRRAASLAKGGCGACDACGACPAVSRKSSVPRAES